MKRNMATIGLFVLALLAGAMTVYFAMPENEVQAAVVEPAAIPDTYVLALDKETGLPVGAVVFSLDGLTCVALPSGAMECACPCDTGTCDANEVVPVSVPVFVPNDLPNRVDDTPGTPAETPGSDDGNSGIPPTDAPSNGDGDNGDDDTISDDGDSDNGDDDGSDRQNGCNQGRGNGPESCDPGNSNHNQDSNDEGAVNRGGNPTPNRNGDNGNNGKAKGKDKDK